MFNLFTKNLLKLIFTMLIVIGVMYDAHNDDVTIEWVHVALIALAGLPWAHGFLDSFSVTSGGVEAKFRQIEEKLEDIEIATTEAESYEGVEAEVGLDAGSLSPVEKDILRAIHESKYLRRTTSGIRRDANVSSDNEAREILLELESRSLVTQGKGKKGNTLWQLTSIGQAAATDDIIRLTG